MSSAKRALSIGYPLLMPSNLQYRSRAVRAMVLLHEEHLRRFVQTWKLALASSLSLPQTDDPNNAPLGALGRHVLSAAGGYMIWTCEVLALPDPGIRSAPDVAAMVRDADDYMGHVLERWRAPLREVPDERLETPEYPTGHSDLEMTGEYTCVSPERQNELTRRIQQKLAEAAGKNGKVRIVESPVSISAPDALPGLNDTLSPTTTVQIESAAPL